MTDEEKGPIVDRIVQRLVAPSKALVLGIVREEYEAWIRGGSRHTSLRWWSTVPATACSARLPVLTPRSDSL